MNRKRMNATRFATVMAPDRDAVSADAEHHEERHLHRDAGDRHDERRDLRDLHAHLPCALGLGLDGADLALGRARGADRAHGADRALDGRGDVADLLLRRCEASRTRRESSVTVVIAIAIDEHGEPEQHGVDDEHRDERADERDRAADGLDEALGQHRPEHRGVAADARDEVARAARVELRDRQAQELRDEALAARQHHALAGALQQVVLVARDDAADDDERDEAPHDPAERLPASTIVITCATSSGWARLVSAPITESTATQMSTGRCSKRKGSSWRKVARGPVAAFPPREKRAASGGLGLRVAHDALPGPRGERMPHPPDACAVAALQHTWPTCVRTSCARPAWTPRGRAR